MLLAEANQWPADLRAYFADGDEFHMAFHFPLMPRMFMGVKLEDRKPITEILQQTPKIPDPCQWCLFLRNHDELTLEMVTDMERDYMYDEYARDKGMRINLGIRRRLAPLLENDRRRIELMNGLLMSLPGTPVIYYGDEIGMGDNINLGDRNGVRTPMQWDGSVNAGFSSADPERLYSAPIPTRYTAIRRSMSTHRPAHSIPCSTGCDVCCRCASPRRFLAVAPWNFSIPRIIGRWRSCASWATKPSWRSTISLPQRKRSNWT